MKNDDENIGKVMKSWRDIDPSPAFEQNVWRCVRQSSPVEQQNIGSFGHILLNWAINRPGYLSAAAALVGLAAGLTGALTNPAPSGPMQNNLFRPIPERSLSASYAHLVTGEQP